MAYRESANRVMPTTRKNHGRCLVLNADWTSLGMLNWREAVKDSWKYSEDPSKGINVIDFYKSEYILGTHGRKYPVPAVGVVPRYKPRKGKIKFSRKNIYIRDKSTCMYCGEVYPDIAMLTLDHVVPRKLWKEQNRHGSPTTWTNIVTCCGTCNSEKADSKLIDTSFRLINGYRPKAPSSAHYILGLTPWNKIEPEWEPHLTKRYRQIIEAREAAGLGESYIESDDDESVEDEINAFIA